MALFGIGKKKGGDAPAKAKEVKAAPAAPSKVAASGTTTGGNLAHVLKHARITEKATMQQGGSVYTFDVSVSATKREIIAAVRALYQVTPEKVAIVVIPSKVRRNVRTGKMGRKQGGKKAYVYLKKGETITIS